MSEKGMTKDLREWEQIRYQAMLDSIYKFRLFWVGLLFAVLSFALQFPVKSTTLGVKLAEMLAWTLLFVTALFAIKDCGGFVGTITEKVTEGLRSSERRWMWRCFLAATLLLLLAKILDAFHL